MEIDKPRVIEQPDMKIGLSICTTCGTLGEEETGVQQFAIIGSSGTTGNIFVLCKPCSEKIGHFLLDAWKGK